VLVIPGRRKAANPESITPVCVYGFRARPTQVGYSRPGRFGLPISGKPEIGGPSRNDEETSVGLRFAALGTFSGQLNIPADQ
jgi:hypothetical protein